LTDAATLVSLEARARALLSKQLWQNGEFDEAVAELDHAIALLPDTAWQIRRAILMPPVPRSSVEIDALRAACEARLTVLLEKPIHLDDPVRQLDWTPYLLSYHGDRSNRTLNRLFHQVCARAAPDLSWQAPHCSAPRLPGRPRIGFISWFLNDHTISRLFGGLIARLDGESFDITVFAFDGNDGFFRDRPPVGKRLITLPADLAAARTAIAGHGLDILIYLDLGMDPFTLFLAHARLARTQAVLWGHPDTTGIPAIDVFLSCDAMEPEDGASHYHERLVRLPGPGTWYPRPNIPVDPPKRSDYGLPENGTLYLCPQTPQKFHPDFDPIIRRILIEDPRAHLVLTAGWAPQLTDKVVERIAGLSDLRSRFHSLPAMDRKTFIGLMQCCDLILDPPHYSGGHTSLEAFATGAPIITWPGHFMRARHTAGFYRLMRVEECVAPTLDSYADQALRLGRAPAERQRLRKLIGERSAILFEDELPVRALEAFLWAESTRWRSTTSNY
jgi:predicted O-linked N-acetylglucosamine transferase (SPINDLY family)